MKKQHLVVFSGAGMSAESGLKTFRDNNGLWENYNVYDVATPEAWQKDKELVLRFYNMRRKQLLKAEPNKAHFELAKLEEKFDVSIITQNIDDLHERAGSSKVIHLHGELMKVQSEKNPELVLPFEKEEIEIGDLCPEGHQLRPNVVWFGEAVPMMEKAYSVAMEADILLVIGTSLNVYPAAGIIHYVNNDCKKYLIDPNPPALNDELGFTVIKDTAEGGVKTFYQSVLN